VIKKEESSDFSGMSLIETSKEINSHSLPAGAVLNVKKGDKVVPGMLLARVPRQQ